MGGRNRGQVLIMFVLALSILVGFVALGIDVGYMYSVRNDLQRSADAGALAGAFAFHDGGWVPPNPLPPPLIQAKAENRAQYFATRDPVGAMPLDNSAFLPFIYPAVNQIQVTVQKNVNLFFAGAIGFDNVTLSAKATAEAIPVDQNVECLTPLAFPYPYTDTNGDGDWDPPVGVEPITPPGSIPQGLPVTFRVANTESPIPSYVINGLGGIGGAGEIFPIIMCGDFSGGQSDLDLRIRTPCHDVDTCNGISIGDTVSLKDDPTYVPAIDEIQDELIDNDSASWPLGSVLPVSTDPRYSGDNWLFSPRVVRIMLYNPVDARNTGLITVTGFAGFWIESVSASPSWPNNADVTGHFVPDSAVGGESASPPIEPSLKTTRLVQ